MITLEMWREFADAVDDDITTSIARWLNHYPPHASTGISSERSTTSCSE